VRTTVKRIIPNFEIVKLDKYIALTGYTSRRKAYDMIGEKRVKVNGKLANFSTKINEGDMVSVDDEILKAKKFKPVYIAYNKPKGIICTTEKIAGNIVDAIGHPEKIYPVGRLDKDSEGLILLTNHGELIDKIANPDFGHEKEYLVTLNLPLRKQFVIEASQGIEIQGEKTKPCVITPEPGSRRIFRIILKQGLNRQIRRMCNKYDYQVLKLQRVRVMHIQLGKLKPGEWRDLSGEELSTLFKDLNISNPA
jgi:23S rRNA pseudouridine2604 synthase